MLVPIWKSNKSELLVDQVGVNTEVSWEVIMGVHRGPMSVEVTVEDLVDIWVHLRDKISRVSMGPSPAEDDREFIVFNVESPD